MRSLTTAQQTVLESSSYSTCLRVLVEDPDGAWVDLTGLESMDWVDRAEWGADIDQPVAEAQVYLRRDHGDLSLAPLDEDSILNRDALGSYAPLLDAGRHIKIEVATVEWGGSPAAGDWVLVFQGKIDAVHWEESPIQLVARDLGCDLVDRWVEEETEYGADPGQDLEDVIQAILNDWGGGVSLYTPVSPGFLVTPYKQRIQSVADAIKALADLIGWDVRYLWSDVDSAFRLTLYEPDRSPSSTAWTFGPSDYFDVQNLHLDRTEIRNVIKGTYVDAAGEEQSVTVSDGTSVSRFGRRWMEIVEGDDSPIDTLSEMETMLSAVLSDLKDPKADQEIETLFWWPGELGDYYAFSPNGVHYSTTQTWALVSIRHTLARDRHRTRVRVRGAPAGAYLHWIRKGRRAVTFDLSPDVSLVPTLHDGGLVSCAVMGNDVVKSIKIKANIRSRTSSENFPSREDVQAETAKDGTIFTPEDIGTLATLASSQVADIAVLAYTAAGGGGTESDLFTAVSPEQVPDGWIDTGQLAEGAVIASRLRQSARRFSFGGSIDPTDWDSISWSSGELYLADGTSRWIDSGSLSMDSGSKYYLYWSESSSSSFQSTTSYLTAVQDGNIMIAVAKRAAATSETAFLVAAVGLLPTVNSDGLGEAAVQFNNIAANAVRAAHVMAAQIQAIHMDVETLSAIVANLGTVNAGLINNAATDPTAGIRLDSGSTKEASWTDYIDLAAAGTDPWLKHDALELLADGSASFAGKLTAPTVIVENDLRVDSGGISGCTIRIDRMLAPADYEITTTLQPGAHLTVKGFDDLKLDSRLFLNLPTDDVGFEDASDTGGTEAGYIELEVGGVTRYIRLHSTS